MGPPAADGHADPARNAAALPGLVLSKLVAQGFIRRRSRARWLAHQLVFWGCILAALVTFPLTLGLLHFGYREERQGRWSLEEAGEGGPRRAAVGAAEHHRMGEQGLQLP